MLGCVEFLIGPITITKILATCCLLLVTYYFWPVINLKLCHVPGPRPLPVLGNMITYSKGAGLEMMKTYGKVFRCYEGRRPTIVVADADKLKRVMIKDFAAFPNRQVVPCMGILKKGLFHTRDEDWRRHRHLLATSFTSGKLKQMVPMIQKCVDNLCENIGKMADAGEEIETKTYGGMFTVDVIASTGFGIDLNSQQDPGNPLNQHLRKCGGQLKLTNPVFLAMFFAPFLLPLMEKMGAFLFPKDSYHFFRQLMLPLIEDRKKSDQGHKDILQQMVNAHKESLDEETKDILKDQIPLADKEATKKELSAEELMAESLSLIFAGYDTTSTTLSFLLYNLSVHQDVQAKLYQEVIEAVGEHGEVPYETATKLPYLEKCIQETLRMFPLAPKVDRLASRDIEVDGLFIPKGTVVVVPIYLMQHDPDVWTQPDKFDPSRFDESEKAKRDPMSHIPFGNGPRQCIGMRLALLELKMATISILRLFQLLPSKKPFEPDVSVLAKTKSGAWIIPKRRE